MQWRWEHFTPFEVLSPAGLSQLHYGNLLLDPDALDHLEKLRCASGPLLVNLKDHRHRGYRDCVENSNIPDSARFSRHLQGIAFDVTPKERSLSSLADLARRLGWFVKVRPDKGFCHIDRGTRGVIIKANAPIPDPVK